MPIKLAIFLTNSLDMKVAFISTFRRGGAGRSAWRTAQAVAQAGIDTSFVVRIKEKEHPMVTGACKGWRQPYAKALEWYERLRFIRQASSKEVRFFFSLADVGQDISQVPEIQEADVLHLHWVHKGFLSLKSFRQLQALGKPIVWSLHDMWAFTGGCHYAGECSNFQVQCGNCWYLKDPSATDLSHQIWKAKSETYAQLSWQIITSSEWLGELAQSSSLFKNFEVKALPTPVDTTVFRPLDKTTVRQKLGLPTDKRLLLFGAMNVADPRKGFRYLETALQQLSDVPDVELLVMGKAEPSAFENIDLQVHYLGYLSGEQAIAEAYNASDFFIMPSLEDNLPNTILESLACGIPSVAFRTGGIPQMIDHQQTGYLAQFKDADDLAKGIRWALQTDYAPLAAAARAKAERDYSYAAIGATYQQLYTQLLEKAL